LSALAIVALPVLALVQTDLTAEPSIWNMIVTSSWVAKIVLLILVVFSLVSWAIIIRKAALFRKLRSRRARFFDAFAQRTSLAEAYQTTLALPPNPLTEVFKAGVRELKLLTQRPEESSFSDNPVRAREPAISILEKESIAMALEREAAKQVEALEAGLPFLATTSSAAPFLGLLGTVWGVMDAFLNIGLRGSGNMAAVAPGVAEALIATVAGLAVAIPAVIAYNYFVGRVREVSDELAHFSSELISVILRERRG
jgi:biopolymer transport protein TolQ